MHLKTFAMSRFTSVMKSQDTQTEILEILLSDLIPGKSLDDSRQVLQRDIPLSPFKGGIGLGLHRKPSTSVRSLSAWSICENRIKRPSGETESPSIDGRDIGASVFTSAVAKLRN